MPDAVSVVKTPADVKRIVSEGVVTERAIDSETDGAREMVFGRWLIDGGVSLPPHVHSADTIAYCVRGTCSFQIGEALERRITMGPGDYVYIPAGTKHTEETGDDEVELIFARDHQGGSTEFFEDA